MVNKRIRDIYMLLDLILFLHKAVLVFYFSEALGLIYPEPGKNMNILPATYPPNVMKQNKNIISEEKIHL